MVELKVGTTVSFPEEPFERVKGIEGRLYDLYSISFDTGFGSGGVDWELDWSLQHPESMTTQEAMEIITNEIKAAGLNYTCTMHTYEDIED